MIHVMFFCFAIAFSNLTHILLFGSLKQGAVGLAIWVPSVVNQPNDGESSEFGATMRGYSLVSPQDKRSSILTRSDGVDELELTISQSDLRNYTYKDEMLLDDLKVWRPL